MIEHLLTEARSFSWVDWAATLTAILYVVLAARLNVWGWAWGIISCSLWAYASFFFYDLWLDALLQLFYVGMGFWGLYEWKFGGKGGGELPISAWPLRKHLTVGAAGLIVGWAFGYFFEAYTPAASTYLDAFTTVFAVIATLILVRKVLENWIYWIIIDTVYVYLYASRGAYLFALLMIMYVGIATAAFFRWQRQYRGEQSSVFKD